MCILFNNCIKRATRGKCDSLDLQSTVSMTIRFNTHRGYKNL